MVERGGYIYRRPGATATELRELLGAARRGWGWTPADMYDAARGDDLARGDDGRACRDNLEIRWRRAGRQVDRYDLLVLALAEQELPGFAPLPTGGAPWRTMPTTIRLRRPAATAGEEDEELAATEFIAPDGSVQFVALIARSEP